MTEDEDGDPAHRIYVFFEDDVHAEWTTGAGVSGWNGTSTTDDDGLTFKQFTQAFMQITEIWHNESRAIDFIYKGALDIENDSEFCTATSLRPALYVHFAQNDPSTSNAGYRDIDDCDDEEVRQIRIRKAWSTDSEIGSEGDYFGRAMLHELGHVIGMGDIDSEDCSGGLPRSVMGQCSNWDGRHPLPWDINCARAYSPGASTAYTTLGFTSGGTLGSVQNDTRFDSRHGFGNVYSRTDNNYHRHSLYRSDGLISAAAYGSDGAFSFADYYMDSSHEVDLLELDALPFLYSAFEMSTSTDAMRVSFVDDENDSSGVQYNPPYAQFVRTDAEFDVTPSSDHSYYRCSNAGCGGQYVIRSHLPVIATYDPVSGNTISRMGADRRLGRQRWRWRDMASSWS